MPKITEEAAAFIGAAKRFGAPLVRVPLTTDEAVEAAMEIGPRLRHPEAALAYARVYASIPPEERAVLRKHAQVPGEEEFWNAFHGEPFAGGELVRRRA